MNAEALLMKPVRGFYPKLTTYGPEPSLHALLYGAHVLDRRLLTRLTRRDFEEQAAAVQAALTDEVIERALVDLPKQYIPVTASELASIMKARRDRLGRLALEFYRVLATDVDVRGTDEDDLAWIELRSDGAVLVRISPLEEGRVVDGVVVEENGGDDPSPDDPYYERLFVPGETGEVRVYLHGGDDRALVTGSGGGPIRVRVIGGGGDDLLEDETGAARFYDHRGENTFERARGTRVSTTPWRYLDPPEGLRSGHDWVPDWGGDSGVGPALAYSEGAGVIVGAGWARTRYGFRHNPYEWKAGIAGQYATRSGGLGVKGEAEYRFENSRMAVGIEAAASEFEAFRFYGFGNDSPELSDHQTLVLQDRIAIFPAINWYLGPLPFRPGSDEEADQEEEDQDRPLGMVDRPRPLEGRLTVGPHLMWTSPRVPTGNPLVEAPPEAFGQAGGRAELVLARRDRPAAPRAGFDLRASASAYPGLWSAESAFGDVAGEARGYLPLLGSSHLALRLGAERVWGDFPAFEAAFVGGRGTLRGYRWNRFAGDASAYGSAELRVPLGTVQLFVNGELGAFGIADAGRVWVDGASMGDWHTGLGGGLWFATLGQAVSVAYVHGERGRTYVWAGLPF